MNMFDNICDILRLFAHVGSIRRDIIVGLVMAHALISPLFGVEQSATVNGDQGNSKGTSSKETSFLPEGKVDHPSKGTAIRSQTGTAPQFRDLDPAKPWIRTAQPMTLLSVNDGQAHLKFDSSYLKAHTPLSFERTNFTRDSITVVQLGPDHPPIVKTVYDTVPNTIMGPAYLATCCDGRYAFVTCHNDGAFAPEHGNILSVIDLDSPNLAVIQKLDIPSPTQAITHPDGKHLIVSCATGFQVFEIKNGLLVLAKNNLINGFPISMDLSPNGDRIVAALWRAYGDPESAGVHVFSYRDGTIDHQHEVKIHTGLSGFNKPFALQFSPDGKRVLSLNGEGQGTKGSLDDVLRAYP